MFCPPYSDLTYLIFSSEAPKILYYSHFISVIVSLIIFVFILLNSRKYIESKILMAMCLIFSAWSISDIFIWTQSDSRIVSFLWSFSLGIFLLMFLLGFYLFYVLSKKEDVPFKLKIVGVLLLLPYIGNFDLSRFDIFSCNGIENVYMDIYTYVVAVIIFIFIFVFSIKELKKLPKRKREIMLTSGGVLLFLVSFATPTIIAGVQNFFYNSAKVFEIEQYSYFSMTFLLIVISYLIVRYKAFNTKVLSVQVISVSLIVATGSQLFAIASTFDLVVTSVSFLFTLVMSYFLSKSVKNEVVARQRIEGLAGELEIRNVSLKNANTHLQDFDKQKSEFVLFATHQLRAPITAMKGYTSLILEGDYGELTEKIKGAVKTVFASATNLEHVVDDYLNISRIDLGTMKYFFNKTDIKKVVTDLIEATKPTFEQAKLQHSFQSEDGEILALVDEDKIRQVFSNIIDNCIKYTPSGSVNISLSKANDGKTVRFVVKDTGVGINPEVIPKLFVKFVRADGARSVNIRGTGLGLFIAKEIVNAHKGKIWAESEGEGKGATFTVELPVA